MVSVQGDIRSMQHHATPYRYAKPPVFEIDMDGLVASTISAIKACAQSAPDAPIAAIAITALGDGTWLLDSERRPIRPALTWRDGRSETTLRRWRSEGRLSAVAQYTGTYPTTAHQTTQIAWLQANASLETTSIRHVLFAEDWIGYALTGKIGIGIANYEHTFGHAHRLQPDGSDPIAKVLDLLELDWLLSIVSEPASPFVPRGALRADLATQIGVKPGLPVFVGPFDVLCAAFGAGAVSTTQASSIWGTAAIHQRWVSAFSPAAIGYLVSHPQTPGRWLRFVATSAGMVNLDYWRNLLFADAPSPGDWTTIEAQLTHSMNGAGSLLYLPYLTAADERSEPMIGVFGAGFLGVQEHHQRHDFLRAVYEGLAVQAARIFRRLEPLDCPLQEVRVAGGGGQSALLASLLASAANLRVVRPDATEASLLGAAMVALVGLGYADSIDQLAQTMVHPQAVYEPDSAVVPVYQETAALIDALLAQLANRQRIT